MTDINYRLDEEFLAPYRAQRDPFKSLIARATYLTKYCRNNETWTDTIRRVVEGSIALDPKASQSAREDEAKQLFDVFWNMYALPPGRGLWVGGVDGIPPEARFNCWGVTLRSIDDWAWTANQLMLGGGVGVGLDKIDQLGVVATGACELEIVCDPSHPNFAETGAIDCFKDNNRWAWAVDDSREGWVWALENVIKDAFAARNERYDVSSIRPRDAPIKTFGGVACGPGPLVALLRAVWKIIRGAAGRRLTSVECLDITNHIGLCIKSGNVRRSALIVLGGHGDDAFRSAKHDYAAVLSHRHTSNNSIVFDSYDDIAAFNWTKYVSDVREYGEPGIFNRWRTRMDDPGATVLNPCGEQALHDRDACNLAEVFPAIADKSNTLFVDIFRLTARYCLRQRLAEFSDPESEYRRANNMRIGVALGGVVDYDNYWQVNWREFYNRLKVDTYQYADELGVKRPISLTTIKPSGTISLLTGSSPGMHAPHAPYYIRRQRIATNDPLSEELKRAGVPCEPCKYDSTGHTLAFEFPVRAENADRVSGQYDVATKESAQQQLARQLFLQDTWADNAVSATISFNQWEEKYLPETLREFVPHLKSTSLLPRAHGYDQAPYEEIDRFEYERRASAIDVTASLLGGLGGAGAVDDECATGVCPVR